MMDDGAFLNAMLKFAVALGLGLLIGLQRERTDSKLAGIRTFPLVTALGTAAGFLALDFGGWVLASGLLTLGIVIISARRGAEFHKDPGITSETAMILMFCLGAYLVQGHAAAAVCMTGVMAMLLHLKPEMHSFARRIGDKDFRAIMQFVLISLVILPVLPNTAFGPFNVLNPFKIWLMVVLIVAMSLAGYVIYKFMDAGKGTIVSGVLGGMISSTATTVSYARRTRQTPASAPLAAMVIMIASTMTLVRVLALIAVAAPASLRGTAGPVGTLLLAHAVISAAAWLAGQKEKDKLPEPGNPSELRPAIYFAFLFAVVLLAASAAEQYLGSGGLYAVAALAGLTDMDAITLSSVNMAPETAWRMIVIAAVSNLAFKGVSAGALGGRRLFSRLSLLFGPAIAAGLIILAVF